MQTLLLQLLTFGSSANAFGPLPPPPPPLQCIYNETYPMLLPSTIIPKHYHLHLKFPDPNDGNLDTSSPLQFEAVVTINVTVKVVRVQRACSNVFIARLGITLASVARLYLT